MSRSGNVAAVEMLLENNARTVTKTFHESPLHTAAENNFYEIAEILLKHNRKSMPIRYDIRKIISTVLLK